MNISTKNLTLTAVFLALIFAVTRFIQIPIPLGYFNIGNTVILLACLLIPSPYGILAAGLGSALADLTSYPVYTIPTLIIKLVFPLIFYILCDKKVFGKYRFFVAAAISTLIPLFGYTITGGILYGGFVAGLAQFPGLFIEYIANLVIFSLLQVPVRKAIKPELL